jgi:hypothetical protein
MTTIDWIYVAAGAFLWGVIVGYWLRKRLPTARDLTDRWGNAAGG